MDEYKSNSYRSKSVDHKKEQTPEKKIERVVSSAKVRKRKPLQKILDVLVQEDPETIKRTIMTDVIIPSIKRGLSDTVNMILYGKKAKNDRQHNGTMVSYRKYYENPDDRSVEPSYQMNGNYNNIIIDNRGEAEALLRSMEDAIKRYGVLSIADFYDMVGMKSSYTDNKYGWSDLRNAGIISTADGYLIKLPKAMALD